MRRRLPVVTVTALLACVLVGSPFATAVATPASDAAGPESHSSGGGEALIEPLPTSLRIGPLRKTAGRLMLTSEEVVDGLTHKQGLARVPGGWIFSWNTGLVREDDNGVVQAINVRAIPAGLRAQGFNHIGDTDVLDGVLYAPLEQDDYGAGRQMLVRYDAKTLRVVGDPIALPLSHASWFAVTRDLTGRPVVWTTSDFNDVKRVLRFRIERTGFARRADIVMNATLQKTQGGDVGSDGMLWISTDDDGNRLFGVDPATGAVTEAGSMGHLRAGGRLNLTAPTLDALATAEGEGIDVTRLPSGDVHTLAIDALQAVSHFGHFARRSVMPKVSAGHACLVNAGTGAGIPNQKLRRDRSSSAVVAVTRRDGCTAAPTGPLVFTGSAGVRASDWRPLARAHAHNDYEHARPLFDALSFGFTSVEADVFLVGNQLLVGHDRQSLRPGMTLQSLYLDPLRERVRRLGGVYRADDKHFQLLVDVKSEAVPTWAVLDRVLAGYDDILVAYGPSSARVHRPVSVVISGNRDRDRMAAQAVRYAAYDGRIPDDLGASVPPTFIPLVSQNFNYLGWKSAATTKVRAKLRDAVTRAHRARRSARFWDVPANEKVWTVLYEAGVDWLNADDLGRLASFLRSR